MSDLILVVEDEEKLAQSICDYLAHENFNHHAIHNGSEVIPWVETNSPNLILLDIMLPGKDGISICREIREKSDVPIIMLTARTDEIDRLLGLELGADDYVCKPFSLRELTARVKAVLRRYQATPNAAACSNKDLQLNKANYHVAFAERSIELTAVEFGLLETLFSQAGRIYSRSELASKAYQDDRIVSDRTVDSHIKKLRKKLAEVAPDEQFIHSIYGVGYKYEV